MYTGVETKLVQNQGKYSTKVSQLQYKINVYMVINITTMFLQAIIHAFVFNRMWVSENSKTHTYIYPPEEDVNVGF